MGHWAAFVAGLIGQVLVGHVVGGLLATYLRLPAAPADLEVLQEIELIKQIIQADAQNMAHATERAALAREIAEIARQIEALKEQENLRTEALVSAPERSSIGYIYRCGHSAAASAPLGRNVREIGALPWDQ